MMNLKELIEKKKNDLMELEKLAELAKKHGIKSFGDYDNYMMKPALTKIVKKKNRRKYKHMNLRTEFLGKKMRDVLGDYLMVNGPSQIETISRAIYNFVGQNKERVQRIHKNVATALYGASIHHDSNVYKVSKGLYAFKPTGASLTAQHAATRKYEESQNVVPQ